MNFEDFSACLQSKKRLCRFQYSNLEGGEFWDGLANNKLGPQKAQPPTVIYKAVQPWSLTARPL